MRNPKVFAAAALLLLAAWRFKTSQDQSSAAELEPQDEGGLLSGVDLGEVGTQAGEVLSDTAQTAAIAIDSFTGGILKVSAMSNVPRSALNNPNVRAFLRVIRRGEGTADELGYRRIFGGQLFDSFADHPRVKVSKSGYTSTAAGAYQFIVSSWDETRRIMALPDFSPASQDYAALGRIAARGALDDVIAGRFEDALRKVAREWASLPGSPYGQPTISLSTARTVYASAGGSAAIA